MLLRRNVLTGLGSMPKRAFTIRDNQKPPDEGSAGDCNCPPRYPQVMRM
jgi:hypothetical protein